MLVLSRKRDQSIRIGQHVRFKILDINGTRVRLGIDAPRDLEIVREELEVDNRQIAVETIVQLVASGMK